MKIGITLNKYELKVAGGKSLSSLETAVYCLMEYFSQLCYAIEALIQDYKCYRKGTQGVIVNIQ